jgi:hypothetical protein
MIEEASMPQKRGNELGAGAGAGVHERRNPTMREMREMREMGGDTMDETDIEAEATEIVMMSETDAEAIRESGWKIGTGGSELPGRHDLMEYTNHSLRLHLPTALSSGNEFRDISSEGYMP